METKYYNGDRLLSMMDRNGKRPEIFICTSNRTAGKTTYFNKRLVDTFLKDGKKFCLLKRYATDLSRDIGNAFFKDIQSLFFPHYTLKIEPRNKGLFYELFIGKTTMFQMDESYKGESCGVVLALSSHEKYKPISHYFSDIDSMLFDEFQSIDNKYLSNEITAFRSIHETVARGQGKQSRYVPVYLIGNPASTLNPYYVSMGIANQITRRTVFMRGNGYVLEQGYNESASRALSESAFESAFSEEDEYLQYASKGEYLLDSSSFISKMSGNGVYVATIKYNGKCYGVREYALQGIVYVDSNADLHYPVRLSVDVKDHDVNYIMLKRNGELIRQWRFLFERGSMRFKNQACKNAMVQVLSY